MVCELKIRQLEKLLGRKLTEKEKKKVREKMHHVEVDEDDYNDYKEENYEEEGRRELEVVA